MPYLYRALCHHDNSISPVMFLADYAYNRGLEYTTVASSTVLVSTSCIFVLFLSVLLGQEPLHQGKVWGVILTVAGTAMTTLHDAAEPSTDEATTTTSNFQQQADVNPKLESVLYGDMFSLMAAVGYAAYSVQVRMLCPADDELYSMTLLLGYVGLISAVPLLPMAIYKFLLLESMSWHTFGILVLKGLLDFLVTDYLLFRAVVLTNATVANVGLGLTIPLAFVADWLVRGMAITSLKATGALVVLVGFLLVNLMADSDEVPQVSVTPTSSGGMPDDESNEETP
jgi:solute carrier family 35 protein F5